MQPEELLVSAIAAKEVGSFSNPTNGFVERVDATDGPNVTLAVHERIVDTIGGYGHNATFSTSAYYTAVIASFRLQTLGGSAMAPEVESE